eukprot:s44_g12.t1
MVHLFDLCLWFGLRDTALALAKGGVNGCILQSYHLDGLPDARNALPLITACCEGWNTCSRCSWGFPLENGVWMRDWQSPLDEAAFAAQSAARMPLVRGLLQMSSRNETLPVAMSEEAAARLLDIAILCGNVEAATDLAKTYQARPLRRWRGDELWDSRDWFPSTLPAALWAGAEFQHLQMEIFGSAEMSLLRRWSLDFELEHWEELEQFLPLETNQLPTDGVLIGEQFLSGKCGENGSVCSYISMRKIRNVFRGGWGSDLKHIKTRVVLWDGSYRDSDASLLDVAILCGQLDCADALGSVGVELREECLDWHRRALRGEHLSLSCLFALDVGSAPDCKCAATAAANASLRTSFKLEGVWKGIAMYQALAKKIHPRGVPMALVHDILGFSAKAPKILDQLDLRREDTDREIETGGETMSEIDTAGETHSELDSEADGEITKEDLPLVQGLKKKKRRREGTDETWLQGAQAGARCLQRPKRRRRKPPRRQRLPEAAVFGRWLRRLPALPSDWAAPGTLSEPRRRVSPPFATQKDAVRKGLLRPKWCHKSHAEIVLLVPQASRLADPSNLFCVLPATFSELKTADFGAPI